MENGVYRISANKGIKVVDGIGFGLGFSKEHFVGGQLRDVWMQPSDKGLPLGDAQVSFLTSAGLDPIQEVVVL
jgi:hypothetical protein